MTTRLEEALTRTLAKEAMNAPPAPADAGRRHRVVAVVLGSMAAFGGSPARDTAGDTASVATPGVCGRTVPSVESVWPEVVRTLPAKLPNGRPYTPHAFFADGGLLVTSESSFEKADAIWWIDPAK